MTRGGPPEIGGTSSSPPRGDTLMPMYGTALGSRMAAP